MVERINIDERPEDADWLKSLQRDDDPELYIGSPTREAARKKRELGSKKKFHARHDQKSHGRRKGGKGVRVIAGAGASKQTVAEVQAEMDRLAKDNPAIAKLMTDSTLSVTIVGTTTEKGLQGYALEKTGPHAGDGTEIVLFETHDFVVDGKRIKQKNSDIAATAVHEVGHAVFNKNGTDQQGYRLQNTAMREMPKFGEPKYNDSFHHMLNMDEAFAESFSALYSPSGKRFARMTRDEYKKTLPNTVAMTQGLVEGWSNQ